MNVPWFSRVIAGTVASYGSAIYVEVGVETGATIRHVAPGCSEVHGVDVQDCEPVMPAGSTFWHMDSDRFFREYDGPPPHVVFVDGLHTYEQASRDYAGARGILASGGAIFLHDTCPAEPGDLDPARCGDVYRLREDLEGTPVRGYTWRAFPGLTMVHPG